MINKNLLVGIFSIFAILAFSITYAVAVPPKANLVPSDYTTGMTWKQAQKAGKPIAVNFYVDWCGYCRKFAPVLEGLRKEYNGKYNIVLINVENPKYKKLAEDFDITGFPTLYLVNPKNDNRVFINQSLYSRPDKLKKEFDRFLKVNSK